jgi:GGDEF domain-containing protein
MMAQQAPVLCISSGRASASLPEFDAFPVIDTRWDQAAEAVENVRPAAVLAFDTGDAGHHLAALAAQVAASEPYVPLIVVDPAPTDDLGNGLPFTARDDAPARLQARLNAALRVRALHATVLRRSADAGAPSTMPAGDPIHDASVLLLGRGACYPGLSIALGERTGVIGALSIEAAAKHLQARAFDGIVIGDGFSPRVVDAFLTVLAEDLRFRFLPVIAVGAAGAFAAPTTLANFEAAALPAPDAAARALPLIRQHAFETRLNRMLQSLDAGGTLDARTGLLTQAAFERNFASATAEALRHGAGLSAARFVFERAHDRIRHDAARILNRLMRKTDFATLDDDGSILVVLTETDLRAAHAITRRLASVLRHTPHGSGRDQRIDPAVTLVTLLPHDTAATLRARLTAGDRRAAS